MTLDYLDLLSNEPIAFNGVGSIKKLRMRDLCSGKDHVGIADYHAYLFILQASKQNIVDVISKQDNKAGVLFKKFSNELSLFEMIMLFPVTASALIGALDMFLEEDVWYSETEKAIVTYRDMGSGAPVILGRVTKDNYDELRDAILKTNHASVNKEEAPAIAETDDIMKKWEQAEKMNQDLQEKTDSDDYSFGNIVSKLCSAKMGITYQNVWDLTIFQAINAFHELGYQFGIHLSERVFSIHGGDHFNMNDWMKNIYSANVKKG